MMKKDLLKNYNDILEALGTNKKLSEILPSVLIFAKRINNQELINWTELEMSSYWDSNPALSGNTIVPEYRKVPGEYYDIYNRPISIPNPKDSFLKNVRMRQSITELESYAEQMKTLAIKDAPYFVEMNKYCTVDIKEFRFTSISIKGILDNIRNVLINKFIEIHTEIEIIDTSINKSNNKNISLENLHPKIKNASEKLFNDGHYADAILKAFISVEVEVRKKSGIDKVGKDLMDNVFSEKNPIIKIANDNNEQKGFMFLYDGAIMAIRNPKAHNLIEQNDPQRALEWISFASVLLRVLDDSEIVRPT